MIKYIFSIIIIIIIIIVISCSHIHEVDLRDKCPPIFDQGNIGSCSAVAVSNMISYAYKNKVHPSPLFIYYNARKIEKNENLNVGVYISSIKKTLEDDGFCEEAMWKYDITKFSIKPSENCYEYAKNNKIKLESVNGIENMKEVLRSGRTFCCGILLFSNVNCDNTRYTGHMVFPDNGKQVLIGHGIHVVGYSDTTNCFIAQNSVGVNINDKGYIYISYLYMEHLSFDGYTIKK